MLFSVLLSVIRSGLKFSTSRRNFSCLLVPIDPYVIPIDPYVIPIDPYVIPIDPYVIPIDPYVIPIDPYVVPIDPYVIPVGPYAIPVGPYFSSLLANGNLKKWTIFSSFYSLHFTGPPSTHMSKFPCL